MACQFYREQINLTAMFNESLTARKIFVFWVPLAATWLMMATEGPFLAAVIARLADPKYNLAAYGVAFSFALFIEAPVIMMMSASTALVKDRTSFVKLRNFTYTLNGIITLIMVIFIIPPVFYFITQQIIGLPENIARLTHYACIILLPWPSAIGYRRFYQGILIRSNITRRVAYGTMIRLISMAATAFICYCFLSLDGAVVGALALSTGVIAEAIASRIMAHASVKQLSLKHLTDSKEKPLSYGFIISFYFPLALTSILGLGVQPMLIFFLGHSRMAIESLAVLPVINSLVFIFRSIGLSFQEVGIALLGKNNKGYKPLRNFAAFLGLGVVGSLALVAFTPFSFLWFRTISGLSLELTQFAILPTKILVLLPGLMVLLCFQRSLFMNNKTTKPITIATAIEVLAIIVLLFIFIELFGMIGAVAVAISLIFGRLLANSYLFVPFFRVLKRQDNIS